MTAASSSSLAYRVGMIVTHPSHPEWGKGKIGHVVGTKVYVFFPALGGREARQFQTGAVPLEICRSQSDGVLDHLPPFCWEGGKLVVSKLSPTGVLSFDHARNLFLNKYPQGFVDPKYLADERGYKVEAHERYVNLLGNGQLEDLLSEGQIEELGRRAFTVHNMEEGALLAIFETLAFKDALHDTAAAERYFRALVAVLNRDTIDRATVEPYLDAVDSLPAEKSKVSTWAVATILPFLAQPDRHMFLKPSATCAAAKAYGFNLIYNSHLNWQTYNSLLAMGAVYLDKLAPYGARDFIDVQSFLWVTCGAQS